MDLDEILNAAERIADQYVRSWKERVSQGGKLPISTVDGLICYYLSIHKWQKERSPSSSIWQLTFLDWSTRQLSRIPARTKF